MASPCGWAVAGTVESSTLPGETAGVWSAVIVRDGSPPRVGIWRSEDKQAGGACDDFLTSFDPAELDPSAFSPVQSGELVPPG